VLAAVGGIGLARIFLLAIATLAFVVAYVVMPSPGKAQYERRGGPPVHVMRAASLLAVAVTGGYASPLLPVFAVPIAIRVDAGPPPVARPRPRGPRDRRALAAPPTSFAARDLASSGVVDDPRDMGGQPAASSRCSTCRRSQAQCLSRLREGALLDAEGRRRGMELMTTKLAPSSRTRSRDQELTQVEAKHATDDKSRRRLEVVLGEVDRIGTLIRDTSMSLGRSSKRPSARRARRAHERCLHARQRPGGGAGVVLVVEGQAERSRPTAGC